MPVPSKRTKKMITYVIKHRSKAGLAKSQIRANGAKRKLHKIMNIGVNKKFNFLF